MTSERSKMGTKWMGGQKQKIDNIEENNEVRVLHLHQYVLQLGRREAQ